MLLVFDLDDTLYLEREYVLSGLRAVSAHLDREGIPGFFGVASNAFHAGTRGILFNQALRTLKVPEDPERIAELVEVYRSHVPQIRPCEDVFPFLKSVASGHTLGLLSDGPEQSQRSKLDALGLRPHLDRVLFTDELGKGWWKPSVLGFERLSRGFPPGDCWYIGDNPEKDFQAPQALGWTCIRIRRLGGLHESKPLPPSIRSVAEICSLRDLEAFV